MDEKRHRLKSGVRPKRDVRTGTRERIMDKREFLRAGLGVGLGLGLSRIASAQDTGQQKKERDAARIARETRPAPSVPHRRVRTTDLFLSPEGYPNAIDS